MLSPKKVGDGVKMGGGGERQTAVFRAFIFHTRHALRADKIKFSMCFYKLKK